MHVFLRDDVTGAWRRTTPGVVTSGLAAARFVFDHIDRVTGVHHLFCAYGTGARLVRGGYNTSTGLIDWEPSPELTGTERLVSGGDCNGWLYACVASDGNPNNKDGGVFWREDGPNPQWHLVHEFPDSGRKFQDARGFTSVAHPKGFQYEVGLVTLTGLGTIACIDPIGGDPRNGHVVTEELNIQLFLGDLWNDGVSIGFNTIAAYNDMPALTDPATGEEVRILGLYVHHPEGNTSPLERNSWYLIRHLNATYEVGQVIDPTNPLPLVPLRGCRAARPSPFPEEPGVLYLGGFDAANPYWHNTAWIYRSTLPIHNPWLRKEGTTTAIVGTETAYGFDYQAEISHNLTEFHNLGDRVSGNHELLEVEVDVPDFDRAFFRWRISSTN